MQQRLDEVQEEIDAARRKAEDDDLLYDKNDRRYYQSGEIGKEHDDQTMPPA